MQRDRFRELGGLDDVNHGGMGREAQEICLKTWLSGGRFVLTRKTWYAHWNKGREHVLSDTEGKRKSTAHAIDLWTNNKWPGQTRRLSWVVRHFAPVPTWPQEKRVDARQFIRDKYQLNGDDSPVMVKGMNRPGLYRLFAELGFKTGCEVGVQRGRNAMVMLDNIPGLKLHLVEPYADHPSNRRKWGPQNHAKFKRMARARLKGRAVRWIEGYSEKVAHKIADRSLDFVYIDGEHTYDFVMIDIILWARKLKKGGILSGHDYSHNKPRQAKVAAAVNDWARTYRFDPIYITDPEARELPGDRCPSWFYVNHRRYLPRQ
jgi:predicted O-methyltransferase YrrM